MEIGCGIGSWLKSAKALGIEDVYGLDGERVDLRARFHLNRRFDLAISVEAAEHLPYQRSETFVADLVALSDVVLFCAALPFQGDDRHVNEQWAEFWAILFRRHGYVACDFLRQQSWLRPDAEEGYAQSLLVFGRRSRVLDLFPPQTVADDRPLSLPHPLTILVNVARRRPLAAEALEFEYEDYLTLLKAHLAGDTVLPALRRTRAFSQRAHTAAFPMAGRAMYREGEIERLATQLAAHQTEIRCVRAHNRQIDDQKARLQHQVEEHAHSLLVREEELRDAVADLSLSLHNVEALRQSWSWRLTAPLRAVVDLAMRIERLMGGLGGSIPLPSRLFGLLQFFRFGATVRASGLFDEKYYLSHYPDVALHRSDPLRHFFVFGAAEGRNPHPLFDVRFYFERNPELAQSRLNPLAHYVLWGAAENRDPHLHFSSRFYLDQNPEVRRAALNPLAHFMGPGAAQGLDPNPWFDVSEYLENNPEVALQGVNPLLHHLEAVAGLRQRESELREPALQVVATPAEAGGTPLGIVVEDRPNGLRASLRADYELSGRPALDSEYDSIPLVSVLIPCFNHGHYLEDAILSAMNACSYPMEIIVVDDGSTDEGSVAQVKELAERYHFRLERQAHTGQSGARHTGLGVSRGKYIQFLDADDFLAPGKIDHQVDMMTAESDIGIAVCEYELCDAAGGSRRIEKPSTLAAYAFDSEDFLLRWERGFCLPIHCALFRRGVLSDDQFPDVTKAGKEDWIFWIVLASRAPRFQYHAEVHATYRIHGGNTLNDKEGMGLDFLRASMYVLQSGLSTCDTFLEESIKHFRSAYLGSIKHAAIVWSRTHPEK